jgi:hypothetical protein
MKPIRALVMTCYAVFGTIFLAAGASVLLVHTGLLPDALEDALRGESPADLHTLHVIQELGALLVFAGLITFWFLRHYEQSQAFHWSLTAFWGLFALVHWFDVRGPFPSVGGPLMTTVPFFLFVSIGLLRTATEGGRRRAEQRRDVDGGQHVSSSLSKLT